jgi:hypothetical protein
MSFNPIAVITIASLRHCLPPSPTVVELGNQRLTVNTSTLEKIIQHYAEKLAPNVNLKELERLKKLSPKNRFPETASFYKALGFQSYTAIDINSKFGSLVMDLNLDLHRDYQFTNTYDLVTNNGTGEHLFNQYQVFKNMHDLAKVDSLMVHIMPFVNWINHGFFSFHPILYADLAAVNDYEVVRMTFANRWGYEVEVDLKKHGRSAASNEQKGGSLFRRAVRKAAREFKSVLFNFRANKPSQLTLGDSLAEISNDSKCGPLAYALQNIKLQEFPNIMIIVALRKTNDEAFRAPIQGRYSRDMESVDIETRYKSAQPVITT